MAQPGEALRTLLVGAAAVVLAVALVLATTGVPTGLRTILGVGPEPLGVPPDVPEGGSFAFAQHQPGSTDEPVTWDPCEAVDYVVNVTGGPDDAVEFVQEGVAAVSAATGLRFRYLGQTENRPRWQDRQPQSLAADTPVLIAWADADEVPQLAGRIAGIGGAVAVGRRGGVLHYVTGGVTLDEDAFDGDPGPRARAILLHELGHLVGLAHVPSSAELMHEENLGLLDFATGDRAGLARLGQGSCR